MSPDTPGYDDTPMLPHVDYCVHDPERPHPPAVVPGGVNAMAPPSDATRLLSPEGRHGWEHPDGRSPEWECDEGVMRVSPGSGDLRTTTPLGDCQLHLEWASPAEPDGEGQGRGNSGVFLMDRYEVQVLDNYENPTYADGYAGAIYGQHPPLANACRQRGSWQSYDIFWQGPRFQSGSIVEPATVTVSHNGVLVQHATQILGPTGHRTINEYEPHPPEAPLRLQDHGDRVRFRNIWFRPLAPTEQR